MITVIASAFRADADLRTNHTNHKRALSLLASNGLSAHEAIGSWKEEGQEVAAQELSLVISASWDNLQGLRALFLEGFKQDAILIINEMEGRLASLAFNDGTSMDLGAFQEIPEAEALASECYTFMDGSYYVAKEVA